MAHHAKRRWEDAYAVIEPQINADSVHVWPFPAEMPVDVRFLRFGPSRDIRLNRHAYFELLYIAAGEVTYQVQDQRFRLHEGDLFVMGSTLMHRICEHRGDGMRAAVLYFLPEVITGSDTSEEQLEYLMPFRVQDAGFPHVVPARSKVPTQVFDLMRRTHGELPAASHRARLSVRTYLRMILVLLVNHYASYRGGEPAFERRLRNLERLGPLFEHIERHHQAAITVEDAAALARMSQSSFMRFFKDATGQSFVGYLNGFRIARAQQLLVTTDLTIAEVGQRTGFCDQSYFGLVFRKLHGISPREYKQRAESARRESA